MRGCKDCAWKALTPYEKGKLIWGMRIVVPRPSLWGKIRDNLSPIEWHWRYQAAKATAHFEAQYEVYYEGQ